MAMMMETLIDRISKAEEKISKKESTIAKKSSLIEKKTAKMATLTRDDERRWMSYEIEDLEEDITRLQREVAEVRESLAKYQAKLAAEQEKAASRNVTAIIEFLENWKRNVMEWYEERFARYLIAYDEYCAKSQEHADWFNHGGWRDENADEINKAYTQYRKAFEKKWGEVARYEVRTFNPETRKYDKTFNRVRLQKELDAEANAKYDDIIERTNAICGKITDARGLWVGNKGDLDGVIIGERGTARVQTIGAGGYNIQCFHFRTLVHEVK